MADRPIPPAAPFEEITGDQFVAAPEIIEWATATFIAERAQLYNPEHSHLEMANVGALGATVADSKNSCGARPGAGDE